MHNEGITYAIRNNRLLKFYQEGDDVCIYVFIRRIKSHKYEIVIVIFSGIGV